MKKNSKETGAKDIWVSARLRTADIHALLQIAKDHQIKRSEAVRLVIEVMGGLRPMPPIPRTTVATLDMSALIVAADEVGSSLETLVPRLGYPEPESQDATLLALLGGWRFAAEKLLPKLTGLVAEIGIMRQALMPRWDYDVVALRMIADDLGNRMSEHLIGLGKRVTEVAQLGEGDPQRLEVETKLANAKNFLVFLDLLFLAGVMEKKVNQSNSNTPNSAQDTVGSKSQWESKHIGRDASHIFGASDASLTARVYPRHVRALARVERECDCSQAEALILMIEAFQKSPAPVQPMRCAPLENMTSMIKIIEKILGHFDAARSVLAAPLMAMDEVAVEQRKTWETALGEMRPQLLRAVGDLRFISRLASASRCVEFSRAASANDRWSWVTLEELEKAEDSEVNGDDPDGVKKKRARIERLANYLTLSRAVRYAGITMRKEFLGKA